MADPGAHAPRPTEPPWLDVPGLEVSRTRGGTASLAARRADVNRWTASIGMRAAAACDVAARRDPALPSAVLDALSHSPGGDLVQLSIELDLCGAWITVANAGPCRGVVVRRAGWVDLRGHPAPPLGSGPHRYLDDRVGLGPGDALVLVPAGHRAPLAQRAGRRPTEGDADDEVLELLLALLVGRGAVSASDVDDLFDGAEDGDVPVVAFRVPEDLGEDRHGVLAAALGVARDELELPGYPLGDLQPDLWSQPPAPPRTARFHLPPMLSKVREVRELLRRLLASWRIAERVAADDVALLASEVVTNAVRHTGGDATVTVRYTGPALHVGVRDGCTTIPTVLPRGAERAGGRGLYLVDAIAAAWGAEPTAGGKVVWFEVPVAHAP